MFPSSTVVLARIDGSVSTCSGTGSNTTAQGGPLGTGLAVEKPAGLQQCMQKSPTHSRLDCNLKKQATAALQQ